MAQILHTVLREAQALAATVETHRFDLAVNPLSAILVTLRALNNTPAATNANYAQSAAQLMSKLDNVRVGYRGASVLDGDPLDLAMIYGRYSQWWPIQGQVNHTDNDTRSVTFPLLFGRKPYDPLECFPATKRGDLVLELDTAANPTGLDGFDMQLETIELLDAVPARFIKVTTTQFSMADGDVNDIDLPIGNKILGLLLRGDRFPTAALNTASFARSALEIDNVEVTYSRILWRALHALWARKTRTDWLTLGHAHTIRGSAAAAAAYAQATAMGISADTDAASITTGTAARSGITGISPMPEINALQRYGWAEFDALEDLSMALDTRAAADVVWHVDADGADAAPSRVLPVEYVEITGAPASPGQ